MTRERSILKYLWLVTVVALAGCDKKTEITPVPVAPVSESRPVSSKTHAYVPTPPECVGPVAGGAPQKRDIAGRQWELSGSTLRLLQESGPDKVVIGALTDIKEGSADNLANLEQFVKWFKKKKADIIVVAGDSGEDREQIEKVLTLLSGSGLPVFVIIGNRDGRKDYREAVAAVSAKHANVFNLNTLRRVDLPGVDLISMPGYHNPAYIHAEDGGCAYQSRDVAALTDLVKACNSPVLLVSHGGPKQDGREGIDRTADGENVGDPQLTAAIKKNNIPFGIFGNIHEAGGRATDLAGKIVLGQGVAFSSMYLNPGPADGVTWIMNDKSESIGMAALLSIDKGKASYRIKRLGDIGGRP